MKKTCLKELFSLKLIVLRKGTVVVTLKPIRQQFTTVANSYTSEFNTFVYK